MPKCSTKSTKSTKSKSDRSNALRAFERAEASRLAKERDPKWLEQQEISTFLGNPSLFTSVPDSVVDRAAKHMSTMFNQLLPDNSPWREEWLKDSTRSAIRVYPNIDLRCICVAPEIKTDLSSIIEKMEAAVSGVDAAGIAAPQIGVPYRLIGYKEHGSPEVATTGTWHFIANPSIEARDWNELGTEGCLSLPGVLGMVNRPSKIVLRGFDARTWEPIETVIEGFDARVICHEVDHLDGILFVDRAGFNSLYWK